MSKDDELVRLRKDNERLLFEQRESNHQIWRSRIKLLMNLKVCVETIKPSPINFRKRWKISLRLRSSPNFFPMLWKS